MGSLPPVRQGVAVRADRTRRGASVQAVRRGAQLRGRHQDG